MEHPIFSYNGNKLTSIEETLDFFGSNEKIQDAANLCLYVSTREHIDGKRTDSEVKSYFMSINTDKPCLVLDLSLAWSSMSDYGAMDMVKGSNSYSVYDLQFRLFLITLQRASVVLFDIPSVDKDSPEALEKPLMAFAWLLGIASHIEAHDNDDAEKSIKSLTLSELPTIHFIFNAGVGMIKFTKKLAEFFTKNEPNLSVDAGKRNKLRSLIPKMFPKIKYLCIDNLDSERLITMTSCKDIVILKREFYALYPSTVLLVGLLESLINYVNDDTKSNLGIFDVDIICVEQKIAESLIKRFADIIYFKLESELNSLEDDSDKNQNGEGITDEKYAEVKKKWLDQLHSIFVESGIEVARKARKDIQARLRARLETKEAEALEITKQYLNTLIADIFVPVETRNASGLVPDEIKIGGSAGVHSEIQRRVDEIERAIVKYREEAINFDEDLSADLLLKRLIICSDDLHSLCDRWTLGFQDALNNHEIILHEENKKYQHIHNESENIRYQIDEQRALAEEYSEKLRKTIEEERKMTHEWEIADRQLLLKESQALEDLISNDNAELLGKQEIINSLYERLDSANKEQVELLQTAHKKNIQRQDAEIEARKNEEAKIQENQKEYELLKDRLEELLSEESKLIREYKHLQTQTLQDVFTDIEEGANDLEMNSNKQRSETRKEIKKRIQSFNKYDPTTSTRLIEKLKESRGT
jgi:hypothetical protein